MFKHSYTSISKRYWLNDKIQEKIDTNVDTFMKKFENLLLHISYPKLDEYIHTEEKCNGFEELNSFFYYDLIKERIDRISIEDKIYNFLELDETKSKKLLISLYEYYLRKEMIENISFEEMEEVKSKNTEKISETFRNFLESGNNENFIEKFDNEINEVFNDQKLLKTIYVNRPNYFLLYRIRNNILREINSKICSEKHIENMIKYINKKYLELYVLQYNSKFFNEIKNFNSMKNEIFEHIEELFLESLRNGKTISVGNELVNMFKGRTEKNDKFKGVKESYKEKINKTDGYKKMVDNFMNFQEEYNKIAIKYFDAETIKINIIWQKDDLKTFIMYCVSEYINDSLKKESNSIDCEKIEKIIMTDIKNKYMENERYDVVFKAKNVEILKTENAQISNFTFLKCKDLKENMDLYLEHKCSKFENDFLKNVNENDIFVLVKNIEVLKRDSTYIGEIVCQKYKDLSNVIYFYTAREKSKEIKLPENLLIIEKNSDFRLVSNIHTDGYFNIKIKSDEWLNEIFNNEISSELRRVLNSINEYNNINYYENSGRLVEAYKMLLNNSDLYNYARKLAILIAGTNNYKYRVTYLCLRFWLIEDYMEFLDRKLSYDIFINERFLVFYKSILSIVFSYNDLIDNNIVNNLQQWILKIFPNDFIKNEEKENE